MERDSDQEENLLLLHHLAVCPACYRVGGYLLDLFEAGAIDLAFSSIDIALARSRAEAPALLARLERYSFPKALGLIRDTRRFRSWGLAELLCSESIKRAAENPTRAVELAELAVAVTLALKRDEPAEDSWLDELRAYAWAHLGNARRVFGELRSAEEAFVAGDTYWERGEASAGDVLGYEAWILCLKASLRLAQGRLGEALALLDRALGANEADHPLIGTLLINKARVLEEMGRLPEAIRLLEEAASRIDPEKRPRVFLCARQISSMASARRESTNGRRASSPKSRSLPAWLGVRLIGCASPGSRRGCSREKAKSSEPSSASERRATGSPRTG
jgi:tetratricopeptide (TPR) repeat protein